MFARLEHPRLLLAFKAPRGFFYGLREIQDQIARGGINPLTKFGPGERPTRELSANKCYNHILDRGVMVPWSRGSR
jgi:hypothetical protein